MGEQVGERVDVGCAADAGHCRSFDRQSWNISGRLEVDWMVFFFFFFVIFLNVETPLTSLSGLYFHIRVGNEGDDSCFTLTHSPTRLYYDYDGILIYFLFLLFSTY